MSACRKPYLVAFGMYARCELPTRHRGHHGPDHGQPVEQRPRHPQTATSRMAYESVVPLLGTIERRVLSEINMRPSTTDEIEVALNGRHQTISAAVSRLWHTRALIRPRGDRRATRSGRLADVYEVARPITAG